MGSQTSRASVSLYLARARTRTHARARALNYMDGRDVMETHVKPTNALLATDFHAQAAEFSLVSLPEKLLSKIVEQDGRCECLPYHAAVPV
jgi:hypothetical protein